MFANIFFCRVRVRLSEKKRETFPEFREVGISLKHLEIMELCHILETCDIELLVEQLLCTPPCISLPSTL